MGVRGPQPSPNARRNGAKVYISPAHAEKLDKIRGNQSKADWLEQIIDEYWENNKMTSTATLISFEDFQAQVEPLGTRIITRNYLDEQPHRSDLAAYDFEDGPNPDLWGMLHRNGEWEVCFNGGRGTGSTLDEAYAAMKSDYKQRCDDLGI